MLPAECLFALNRQGVIELTLQHLYMLLTAIGREANNGVIPHPSDCGEHSSARRNGAGGKKVSMCALHPSGQD